MSKDAYKIGDGAPNITEYLKQLRKNALRVQAEAKKNGAGSGAMFIKQGESSFSRELRELREKKGPNARVYTGYSRKKNREDR